MKTYLFDSLNRYKRFSENLDIRTTLCNKTWCVFNDTGEKEIYIFQEDGKLIISVNGIVTFATWQFTSANKSLIINTPQKAVMLQPSFIDDVIFSLRLDGTNDFAFLIDESNKITFKPKSLSDINSYFNNKILEEKQRIVRERKEKIRLRRLAQENERNAKIEKEKEEEKIREKQRYEEILKKKVEKKLSEDVYYNELSLKCYSLMEMRTDLNKYFTTKATLLFLALTFLILFLTFFLIKTKTLSDQIAIITLTSMPFDVLVILGLVKGFITKKIEKVERKMRYYINNIEYQIRNVTF